MKSEIIRSVVALRIVALTILALTIAWQPAFAAPPVIGTVLANGSFRLDGATVRGNGTLFEGSTVETSQAGSSIQLSSGARLTLGAGSRGKLYGDHIQLEKGEGKLEDGTGFRLVALGLTIQPDRGLSTGRVALEGTTRVQVAALTGSFHVLNARGLVIANMVQGTVLAFEPQVPASTATRITGLLEKRDGHFVVTDEVTNVTVEVSSATPLDADVGGRVELIGKLDPAATPVSGASQVIRVSQVKRLSKPPAGTAPAGSGGSGAGVSVATIAIVGGVVAAATLGGLAAAGSLSGQSANSISR